jgi:hypothetical protein
VLSTTGGGAKVLLLSFKTSGSHNFGPNYLFNMEITSGNNKSKRIELKGCCQYSSTYMPTNAIGTKTVTYTTINAVNWIFDGTDDSLEARITPLANSKGSLALILGFTKSTLLPYTEFHVVGVQNGNAPPPTTTLTHHQYAIEGPADFRTADLVTFDNFSTLSSPIGPYDVTASATGSYHDFRVVKTEFASTLSLLRPTSKCYVTGVFCANESVKLKYPSMINLRIWFDNRMMESTMLFEGHKRSTDVNGDADSTVVIAIGCGPLSTLIVDSQSFTFPRIKFESPVTIPKMMRFQITDEDGFSIPTSSDWSIILDPIFVEK